MLSVSDKGAFLKAISRRTSMISSNEGWTDFAKVIPTNIAGIPADRRVVEESSRRVLSDFYFPPTLAITRFKMHIACCCLT